MFYVVASFFFKIAVYVCLFFALIFLFVCLF